MVVVQHLSRLGRSVMSLVNAGCALLNAPGGVNLQSVAAFIISAGNLAVSIYELASFAAGDIIKRN
jgi:hypothetical protein